MNWLKRAFFRALAREERSEFLSPIVKEAKKKTKSKSEKRTPTKPDLWNRAKAEAKKRFKVWPSAYCVPLSSQALTQGGWKDYHQLKVGELILSFDMSDGEIKWSEVKDIHFYSNSPTFNLFNNDKTMKLVCTPDHKWVIFEKGNAFLAETKNLLREGYLKGLRNFNTNNPLKPTWDEEITFLSNITIVEGEAQDVWCPETEYGTWIMKQGNKIVVTGNSSGWAAKWYKEHGGGWRGKKPIK